MVKILLTGAAGHIGRTFYAAVRGRYRFVLSDRRDVEYELEPNDRFELADLSVHGPAERLVENVDVVVHLAAVSDERKGFADVLPANIVATTWLLEAAARTGVARFVFASSIHAVKGYPADQKVVDGAPVRPVNAYGVTKCYGEALCASYASRGDLSAIALRIGDFEDYGSPEIADAEACRAWISPADIVQLLVRSIEAQGISFFIAHGVSNNRVQQLALEETRRVLGYTPRDDAFVAFPAAYQ